MAEARLKKGKEKAVKQLHPWIFSGAIDSVKGKPINGQIISVTDSNGDFLAKGFYNNQSRVAIRLIEWDEQATLDEDWWRLRVKKAVKAREGILNSSHTNVCRLVFSEADYLPGLIVDKYADFLSVQIHTNGIENVKHILLDELQQQLNPSGIFDRSDAS